MSVKKAPDHDDAGEDVAPSAPKPRLKPRRGLRDMALYVNALRLRARMSDGRDATEAWLLLEPEDIEALDDIAGTLDLFAIKWPKLRVADKHWPLVETILKNKGYL